MNRRILLATVLSCLTAGGLSCQPQEQIGTPAELSRIAGWRGGEPNSATAFRFIVLSDRTGGHQQGAWARTVAEVNRLKPDFVMCVGDLIEGYCDAAKAEAQWAEFDDMTRQLEAPFFYCPGNHDIESAPTREVYTRRHARDGSTYYSFNYRGCHFVVLDSSAMLNETPKVTDAQWSWLEKDLAAARAAKHVFVFEHHPLYSAPAWARLRKMLDPDKTTVFSGHWHTLSYDTEDDVPYFVLGPTATQTGPGEREEGQFQMFAHVTVSHGRPAVSIIPLGQVLPHDFISRALPKRLSAVGRGISLDPLQPGGKEVVLGLTNGSDCAAAYTLSWTGSAAWFADGRPPPETLTLRPGESAKRTFGLRRPLGEEPPPVLAVEWQLAYAGQTGTRRKNLPLLVPTTLTARRAGKVAIDGRLDDWAGHPACLTATRWRVRDNPDDWAGANDCALATRVAYDDRFLYVAADVTDEAIVTEAPHTWLRDGLEFFWDPRPAGKRGGRFADPCRQVMVPVPPKAEAVSAEVGPAGAGIPGLRVACRRRDGGYTVELAVPLSAVSAGFKPGPGKTLRMEVFANDKDDAAAGAKTTCMVLSGDSDASRNTIGYALVQFE